MAEQSPREESGADRCLILGLGNLLRRDDGVGVHAVRQWQRDAIPGVRALEVGTAILHALSFLETAERALLIDAARGGRPPGTIYLFEAEALTTPHPWATIHAVGLREALRLLPPRAVPPRLTMLGVEPAALDFGLELSPCVAAALPQVLALARETVLGWLRTKPPRPRAFFNPKPLPI